MQNYKDSDYALNKYSEGIVYKFADSILEITVEDYLRDNPDKTRADFAELKALSDEIYHEQVIQEHRTGRLNVSISGLEETCLVSDIDVDTELIEKGKKKMH